MEGSTESGSVQSSSTQTSQSSQSAAPSGSQPAPVTDNAAGQAQGQASGSVEDGSQSQAAMPQLDEETKTWMGSKGLSYESLTKDPMKVLQMYRNAESHMSKSINELKEKYETELKLKNAQTAIPGETQTEDKKPTVLVNEKFERKLGDLLNVLAVNNLDEFVDQYPYDQYPALHESINKIRSEYNLEYQKALADDVEYLHGGGKKKGEQAAAQERLQKEWEGVKTAVSTKFEALRKSNPQIDENIKMSGVGDIVNNIAQLIGVPHEYVWHDSKTSDFFIKAANAIMFMQNAPKLQEEWKQNALREFEKQKQIETPSVSDGNFLKVFKPQRGTSLLD